MPWILLPNVGLIYKIDATSGILQQAYKMAVVLRKNNYIQFLE